MKFNGIIPPVVTLFDSDGKIDLDLNRRYLDKLIQQGVHGLLLTGSSGEFTSMTMGERKLYVAEMLKYIDKRVPVIVGVGHTALQEVLELCDHAEEHGADGVLVVNPYYWHLSEEQIIRYYSLIAEHTSLAIILYNVPSLSGQSLSVDLVKKLAGKYQNICGIKETVSEISHIREMITAVNKIRDDFMVFSAFDEHMLPALMIGAAGSINGSSVFAPEVSVDLYEEYRAGNLKEAQNNHQLLSDFMEIYSFCPTYFTSMKEAVHQRWFSEKAGHRAPFDVYPPNLPQKISSLLLNAGYEQSGNEVNAT